MGLLDLRMQYFRMARRALVEGRLGWLAKTAAKTLVVPLSHLARRPLGGPVMANLVPTYRCNNDCFMCDLPKPSLYARRGTDELDTRSLCAIIDDLAAIGVVGLSLAGGEPTLRPDCFELLAHGKRRGLFVHLNTNGYNLHQEARMAELLAAEPASMNVSLDGATAETHDRVRRARHGFERIERLTELWRRHPDPKPSLTYTFVFGPDNFHEVPALLELARKREVTSVSFNPLTFVYEGAKPIPRDTLAAMDVMIDWLRDEKAHADDPEFIDNSDAFLSLFPRAYRGEPSPLKCYVGYHNVVVDAYGNVYPCTVTYQRGEAIGNVRGRSLVELWRSDEYQRKREQLVGCTDCLWNCHTEINLLYQRPG